MERLNREGFVKGQRVRILDGPFGDFEGVIDEIDLVERKVKVVVSFFGTLAPLELDFVNVKRVST